jgi:TolB protein
MPDSESIIYSSIFPESGPNQTSALFSINIATMETSLFFDTHAEETQPAVSPDGTQVAFLSFPENTPESNRDIYILNLGSQELSQITTHTGLDWRPTWQPDGERIFFESYRIIGNPTIWAINIDGSNLERISSRLVSESNPDVAKLDFFLPLTPDNN